MLFDSWSDVVRVSVMGAAAYSFMVVLLRVSGKRTLAALNAFDLVVTVALGSILATIALSSEVSLADGLTAIVVLVAAQSAVAWLSVHAPPVRRFVRAEASVVFSDGDFDTAAMTKVRLTEGEIRQAIRSSGSGDLEQIAAVVLETNGSLSVIAVDHCHTGTALPAQLSKNKTAPCAAPSK